MVAFWLQCREANLDFFFKLLIDIWVSVVYVACSVILIVD